jgi:hypothetical protein
LSDLVVYLTKLFISLLASRVLVFLVIYHFDLYVVRIYCGGVLGGLVVSFLRRHFTGGTKQG